MPICVQKDLPAREILENENIFTMEPERSMHQDIRPLEICILNLMPLKEDTELQLLRSLSNTPLQINITFMTVKSHISKNTPVNHLNQFYTTWYDIKDKNFDGMIVTGAPVEQMEYTEVDYWDEMVSIMDWSLTNVTSTLHLCWGAQAALYHHYGLQKHEFPDGKLFGVYQHRVKNRKDPLVRGFDDLFYIPHSRYTEVRREDIYACPELKVLAEGDNKAGVCLCTAKEGRQVFLFGHPEYDRLTLDKEYRRDLDKGLDVAMPLNYYPGDDPDSKPMLLWRSHANIIYTNWLDYYVYQSTPYDIGVSLNIGDAQTRV
ncbi:MAG: homoserine O-succinyltransferase [Lachnospiraceae bacterium]|nr:homoserine O-succinyltransferase [Lachnospiraceae bacterium]MBQ4241701.1 homoserine O-succinyltransferase [Lachnospiraceae bacterium]MBQ5534691.1 homoserine O-succinyltransferase [Lachnospiraceae bacterium]